MQPMKHGNFEQQIRILRRRTRFVYIRHEFLRVPLFLPYLFVCLFGFLWFAFNNNSENVPVNKQEILKKTLLLLLPVCVSLILFPVLGEDEDIDECRFFVCISHNHTKTN